MLQNGKKMMTCVTCITCISHEEPVWNPCEIRQRNCTVFGQQGNRCWMHSKWKRNETQILKEKKRKEVHKHCQIFNRKTCCEIWLCCTRTVLQSPIFFLSMYLAVRTLFANNIKFDGNLCSSSFVNPNVHTEDASWLLEVIFCVSLEPYGNSVCSCSFTNVYVTSFLKLVTFRLRTENCFFLPSIFSRWQAENRVPQGQRIFRENPLRKLHCWQQNLSSRQSGSATHHGNHMFHQVSRLGLVHSPTIDFDRTVCKQTTFLNLATKARSFVAMLTREGWYVGQWVEHLWRGLTLVVQETHSSHFTHDSEWTTLTHADRFAWGRGLVFWTHVSVVVEPQTANLLLHSSNWPNMRYKPRGPHGLSWTKIKTVVSSFRWHWIKK